MLGAMENHLGRGNNSDPWYAAGLGQDALDALQAKPDPQDAAWLAWKQATQDTLKTVGEEPRLGLIQPQWGERLPGDPPPLPPAPLDANSCD